MVLQQSIAKYYMQGMISMENNYTIGSLVCYANRLGIVLDVVQENIRLLPVINIYWFTHAKYSYWYTKEVEEHVSILCKI